MENACDNQYHTNFTYMIIPPEVSQHIPSKGNLKFCRKKFEPIKGFLFHDIILAHFSELKITVLANRTIIKA